MKFLKNILLIVVTVFIYSCENNQFQFREQYDPQQNLARERPLIADYLLSAPYDSLYRIHDPQGVVIIVQEEGTGVRPKPNTIVYTNYVGKLLDGTVFDTNIRAVAEEHGLDTEGKSFTPFSFPIDQQGRAIAGFSMGFKHLRSGSKAVIIIPSPHAYQNQAQGERLPPNSILVFEVDFLGID
jgi:FKBP-type peptidyl-prolyl cis-trans isomerase FkpA